MSKLIILLCSALSAFGSEASKEAGDLTSAMLEDTPAAPLLGPVPSTTLDNVPEFFLRPPPLRRQTRELDPETIDYVINNHTLKWKLITMVRYVGTNGITEQRVIDLIKSNPGNSNPYSDSHQAHIIALACRVGHTNIVSAIIESNPEALNCNNSSYTPLGEAIDHDQMDVAQFLREKGAIETRININESELDINKYGYLNREYQFLRADDSDSDDDSVKTEIIESTENTKEPEDNKDTSTITPEQPEDEGKS